MPEITIELTTDELRECRNRVEPTEFESVEEYVQFVVSAIVEAETEESDDIRHAVDEEQLESLGYL